MGGLALQWPLSDNSSGLMGIKLTIPTCLATCKYESDKLNSVSNLNISRAVGDFIFPTQFNLPVSSFKWT